MPIKMGNVEDWSKKLGEVKLSGVRDMFKGGLTKKRVAVIAIILVLAALFILLWPFASFYTDALWYTHIGFQNLFWKMFWAKILMVVVFGAVFFAVLYGNILLARKIPPEQKLDVEGSPLEATVTKIRKAWSRLVGWLVLAFCIVAAFFAGLGWGGKWESVLKFLNHASYGKTDPIFNKDIGYYLFSYPFLRMLVDWIISSLIFVLIITAVVYILDGGIRLRRGPDMFAPRVKAHLSVLLGLIFLAKAWSYRLNMYELLFAKRGAVWGAGYTATHAQLPALWIMMILAIVCAVILIINIRYRGWVLPAVAVGALIVVTIIAGSIYPLIIQNYVVKPNEREKETTYLEHNIEYTRDAYDISKVQVKPFAAELGLDMDAIVKNLATVRNIRLWDPRPLLESDQQLQAIRQYYKFNDVDVDRYMVDNVYRQTMIAAREMIQSNLPSSARTWVNNVLVYTHGYGVCMNPSNDTTNEGNPNFIVKDIPPVSTTNVKITRPEIYFGELESNYIVSDTSEKEFDYPKGEKKILTEYKGDGGVKVKSFWRKILFAARFRDVSFLFSGQINGGSQVLWVRNVSERVAKCAPFLKFDRDPYIVIDDSGKPFWILDCYATSDKFPYSQPTSGLGNYVRNSVKAVVDAYDGRVWLYVVDPKDPVIRTYRKIFPQIFTPLEKMPGDLKKHMRYPEDFYLAQADILRTYHMTDPQVFYSKEDEWDFPQEIFDSGKQPMVPYYVILKLPDEQGEEMVLMMPFVPHNKQNMISWLGARMDGEHYGELINYYFPSGRLIYGPEQIEGRIEQEPDISRQLSLWRQAGSQVIRGNLLVIPIQQSLLYVEPLYLQATQLPIPQVKRVVVVYGQQVAMEPTLEQAIVRVFSGVPTQAPSGQPPAQTTPEPPAGKNTAQLAAQAQDLFNKATEAQKAGDWAAYGNYIKQLQDVLNQLAEQTK